MCSISEDQSLPADFNGTSLQLSSTMDSTIHDHSSLSNSDVETPGLLPTLNSVGGISPHRVRTMKDQEEQLSDLRKDNFGLKLRIYHLEEALSKKWGDKSEGWQLNIDLQVQMDNLKKELAEKDALIMQARSGLNSMAAKHAQELNELRQAVNTAEDVHTLQERLEDKEAELEDAQLQTEEATARANEMQTVNEQLEEEMRQKDREMEDMQRELDDVKNELTDQQAMAKAPVPARNAMVQTTEPVVSRAETDQLRTQLADTTAQLQERERSILELHGEISERAARVKDLEIELLTASQKLAAGAGVHAQQMSEQADHLDRCKAKLRDAEAELRRQATELGEKERECKERERETEDARRRAREAEERAASLEPRARSAERDTKDLRRQLREAQIQTEEEAANKAREMRDMEERLREMEGRLGRSRPEMAARQRELDEMARTLGQKEEEISQLRSQLEDKEDDLSRARRATHNSNIERQEQAKALGELRGEMDELRDQLQQKQATVQHSMDAALGAKDAIIGQLQRELHDLQAKLAEADDRLLHLVTSKAAEMGVMQGTVDELAQQLEQLEGQLHGQKREAGRLSGEKVALLREVEKLRAENEGIKEQLAEVAAELATKSEQLQAAHEAIAELQKQFPSREQQQKDTAEKAQLKSQLASLRAALANKETEAQRLGQALELKDATIRDLRRQLKKAEEERAKEAEKLGDLQRDKSELQSEIAGLQSQGRIAHLSADDLQARLTDAYREREELGRKLRQAEEALRNKDSAYERARKACEELQRQVVQLQEQVTQLSRRANTTSVGVSTSSPGQQDSGMMAGGVDESVGTSPPQAPQGGPSSTTMIFGSLSEDLLKTILQRLQEIYAEVLTNRTSGSQSSSTLQSKMEHLTDLQRHLEACFHENQSNAAPDSKPASGNTSYTAYYFMRGEDGEPLEDNDGGAAGDGGGGETPPRKSSTPKKRSPRSPPKASHESFGTVPVSEAQAQIGALQSELEEVKRWNEALQTRLKESGGTRDVGVGMEKGATAVPTQSGSFAQEKYLELEAEVDRLLGELEAERERSTAEREQQETECAALQGELGAARERVGELEVQLREAMMRDAGTSMGETETHDSEMESLQMEIKEAEEMIARLKGQLQAEKDDNQRLRSELGKMRTSPSMSRVDRGTSSGGAAAASSMPNLLLTPDRTPRKNTSDSWTSPGATVDGLEGEGLDMTALKQRHEEVTRLNQELQRKCREQLHKSPPSTTTSPGQKSKRFREENEREASLLTQLRQSEARAVKREGEWRDRESDLRRQLAEVEGRLGQCNHDCETIQARLTESLAARREKDEEILNMSQSLSTANERVHALELQLEQLMASKNAVVSQQLERERELQAAHQRAEELGERVKQMESERHRGGRRQGDEDGNEGEVETLRQSIDSLTQQLTSALEDLERLQRHNAGLEESRNLLHSQLSSCQEQVATLQAELKLYQKLLQDSTQVGGGGSSAAAASSSRRLLQLLEQVRRLREQLNQGVRNSDALAQQLHSKLEEQQQQSEEEDEEEEEEEEDEEEKDEEEEDEEGSYSGSQVHLERKARTSGGTQTAPSHTRTSHRQQQTSHSWRPHTTFNQPTTSTVLHHTPSGPEAKISLGGIGTLTVKADVQMTSDTSTASLPQLSASYNPSLYLSAPQSQSSPFVRGVGLQSSSHTHSASKRAKGTSAADSGSQTRQQQGTHTTTDGHSFNEYLSREGIPKLEPVLTPLHSRQSSSAASAASLSGGIGNTSSFTATRPRPVSSTAAHPPSSTVPGGVQREFESLESRLKQALESSTLQGADRSFLEELLGYLRQQRRQLDESWRLLENMEQGGASRVAMETSQSGTIRSSSATSRGGTQGRKGREHTRGVDLSSLYEHLLKTQASLIEAKANLNSSQKHT